MNEPVKQQIDEIIANAQQQDAARNTAVLSQAAAQMWEALTSVSAPEWSRVAIIQNYLDSLIKYAHHDSRRV